MYGLRTIVEPTEEPLALDRAKLHLKVDHDEEDPLIAGWIAAARLLTEKHTGRRWVTQTVRLTLAAWPRDVQNCDPVLARAIPLPVGPVSAVSALACYATDGPKTLAVDDDYQLWLDAAPPLVLPAGRTGWPALEPGKVPAVTVEFVAGYGGEAQVPEDVKAAIELTLGYWHGNRGDGTDPTTLITGLPQTLGLPPGAKRLLDLMNIDGYR